jgi:predicted HAD superfamily Cof-like phosphohydrolase
MNGLKYVYMSNADQVLEFTKAAGRQCSDTPEALSSEEVKFIIRMVMSEMCELATTVTQNSDERDALLNECLENRDRCNKFYTEPPAKHVLIADQYDAMVDAWYYCLDISSKHGVNLSKIFDVVHAANMAKMDPETGKFKLREDGKILKPPGWSPPDVEGEILNQIHHRE